MPVYSHSQLSTYEGCPLRYKLCYRDRIKREVEGVEAFLGNVVHQTLQNCYEDVRHGKLDSLTDLLACYDSTWGKGWHEGIVITRKNMAQEHYRALGRKMVEAYYRRYAPFSEDITISTEMQLSFALDAGNKYRLRGYIDRLSRSPDDVFTIHDYKTSAHLPAQEEADNDRQLGLYHIGVQKRWPKVKDIRLIWHYLAFDQELVSARSTEALASLADSTSRLIDEIEAAREFPPRESGLCEWCEYPDLCPVRKHLHTIASLPESEACHDSGVTLVDRYAGLKGEIAGLEAELEEVTSALLEYTDREHITRVMGTQHRVNVRTTQKLKFPGKNDAKRRCLDEILVKAGRWMEVSQLDTTSLSRRIEAGDWNKALVDEVMKYGRLEKTRFLYLSQLKEYD